MTNLLNLTHTTQYGLAGFAFAIVAAAVWLHFLPPAQSTVLIAAFGLIVRGGPAGMVIMSAGCYVPSSITIASSAMCDRMRPEGQVRSGLAAGGRWIRTIGPAVAKVSSIQALPFRPHALPNPQQRFR